MTRPAEPATTHPIAPRLLRVEQAAQYLGITISFVESLYRSGTLKPVDLRTISGARQKRTLFDVRDLDAYVERMKAAPQA